MNRAHLAGWAAIAREYLAGAESVKSVTVHLGPDLELCLYRRDETFTLTAIRPDFAIDSEDAGVIADAFGVPVGADPHRSVRCAAQRLSNPIVEKHTLSWSWTEAFSPGAATA